MLYRMDLVQYFNRDRITYFFLVIVCDVHKYFFNAIIFFLNNFSRFFLKVENWKQMCFKLVEHILFYEMF